MSMWTARADDDGFDSEQLGAFTSLDEAQAACQAHTDAVEDNHGAERLYWTHLGNGRHISQSEYETEYTIEPVEAGS